jgi:TetR/AcrR family transcriptional regulator, fatty acid metabolism regulator protein
MAVRTVAARRAPAKKRVRQKIKSFARAAYRQAILDAAESAFSRLGYRQAKMSDVASEAGVSIGTLYNHFRSKELIFSSLVEQGSAELSALVKESETIADCERRLSELVQRALAFVERRGALFAVYAQLGALSEAGIARVGGKHVERAHLEYLELLASTFEQAARAGKVRDDIEPRAMAAALSGSMHAAIFEWIRTGRGHDLTARADVILRLLMEGARPR